VVHYSEKFVASIFSNWSQMNYADVELAISILYILGEVITVSITKS